MENFLHKLPKVELHAHLNGSLNINSIRELGELLYGGDAANNQEFLDLSQEFINFESAAEGGRSLEKCFQKFKFMHQLTATRQGLELATQLVIRDFAQDNVMYLEMRSTPKSNDHMTKREYLECVLETIVKSKQKYPQIRVKLLPSFDRGQNVAAAEETLKVVLELSRLYPGIITGIDLSGNPNCGHFRDFKPLLEQARQNKLKLALHCAEIANPQEIAEMLDFGMERCGHGTFLTDDQRKHLGQQNTTIECCLTSNVKCRTVTTYDDHHFRDLFADKSNQTVVLCTDDSGVFDTTLTQELMRASKTFRLQEQDFYRLTMNAVNAAFADETEKQEMETRLAKYFEEYYEKK